MQERRKIFRGRTYLGGQIAFDEGGSSADCVVRNLTHDGAKIVFSALAPTPAEFDFTIRKTGDNRRTRIVWRRGKEAGVFFTGPAARAAVSIEAARKIRALEAERETLAGRLAQLIEPTW